MRQIRAIAKTTFKEGMRERIFGGVIIFSLLALLSSGFIADLSIGNILKVTQDIGLSVLSFLGIFISLFLTTNLIAKDLDKKTIYLVISKPIHRWEYIIGKFLGLCTLTAFALSICFLIFLITLLYFLKTAHLWQIPDIAWMKLFVCFLFLNLKMFLLICIAIFFSSFASSSLLAFFLSFPVYLIGSNLANVKSILASKVGEDITPVLKTIFNVSYWFFPNLSMLDMKLWAIHNLTIESKQFFLSFTYGIVYSSALIFLASYFFDKRELN